MKLQYVVLGAVISAAVVFFAHSSFSENKNRYCPLKPLSEKQKNHYEKLARLYMSKLWTNNYSKLKAHIFPDELSKSTPNSVRAKFENGDDNIVFVFPNRDSDTVIVAHNPEYQKTRSSALVTKPVYTTREMAEKRADEIANTFGVSNLWDKSSFEMRSFGFVNGIWEFQLSAFINGYSSLYHVSIFVTDTPDMNLYRWNSTMGRIPSNLSTNVVLTATQGQAKAREYLDQYYPNKDTAQKATFMTNSVEYVTPNYNYVRENGMDEFWDGGCTNAPVLVWKNYFQKNSGFDRTFPILIYVDAETGEMLGGM